MKVTFRFCSLADAYTALMLAYSGYEVELIAGENLKHVHGDWIMSRFVDEEIFSGTVPQKPRFSYAELSTAAALLNSMSPNTVYPEAVYAVQDRNALRDFTNLFRKKAYRDIHKPETGTKILRDGISLLSGKVWRCAPAYRINYSRLVDSVLRTLRQLGSDYKIVADGEFQDVLPAVKCHDDLATTYKFYKFSAEVSPSLWKTVYIPGGVWLFSRSNDFYIAAAQQLDVEMFIDGIFDGYTMPPLQSSSPAEFCFYPDDLPFEALLSARANIPNLARTFDIDPQKIRALDGFKLDGSDFKFSPSMADVVGYADYWYDTVKRLGINVGEFRDAVFDYGTHIEEIVNDTYDLYAECRNGNDAFRRAITLYRRKM